MILVLTHVGAFVAGSATVIALIIIAQQAAFRNWWGP